MVNSTCIAWARVAPALAALQMFRRNRFSELTCITGVRAYRLRGHFAGVQIIGLFSNDDPYDERLFRL